MPTLSLAQEITSSHLLKGNVTAGSEVMIRVYQTLCPDSSGTIVFLELEAIGGSGWVDIREARELVFRISAWILHYSGALTRVLPSLGTNPMQEHKQ
jgi:hypothetical protein